MRENSIFKIMVRNQWYTPPSVINVIENKALGNLFITLGV
jgi:hypothetical protein